MAEKSLVTQLIVNTEGAIAPLKKLEEASKDSDQAIAAVAASVAAQLEEVVEKTGKLSSKVADGGSVSKRAFDEMATAVDKLRTTVTTQFESIEKAPVEFRNAVAAAETRVTQLAGAMAAGAEKTTRLRDEFQGAAEAARKLETETSKLDTAAEQVDAAFEKFTKTLNDNPKEAIEQLPQLAARIVMLRQEIEATQRAGGPVDEKALRNLENAGEKFEELKDKMRSLKSETDSMTAGVNDASQSWKGFGGLIDDALGKMGKFGVGAIAGFAAFKEGLALGQEFNQFVKTDMSEWNEAIDELGAKAKAVVANLADQAIAAWHLLGAAATLNKEEIKKAWEELNAASNEGGKIQTEVLTKWGADWQLLHPKIKSTKDAILELAKACKEDLKTALDFASEAQTKATLAKMRDAEVAKEQSLQTQLATSLTAGLTEKTEAQVISVGNHTEAIKQELAAVRELLSARGVQRDQLGELNDVQMDAGVSTDYLLQKEAALLRQSTESISVWNAEKEVAVEKNDAQKKLADLIEEEKKKTESLTTAKQALHKVIVDGREVWTNLGEDTKRAGVEVVKFKDDTMKAATEVAKNLAEMRAAAATELAALREEARLTREEFKNLQDTMRETGKAAADMAGGEGDAT